MIDDGLFDDFGHPAGQDDIARTDDVLTSLFIDTHSTRAFLERVPEYQVVYGPMGSGKSLLLFKRALQIRQKAGVLIAPQRPYAFNPTLSGVEKWTEYWPLLDRTGRSRKADWAALWAWAIGTVVLRIWAEHARDDTSHRSILKDIQPFLEGTTSDNPYDLISHELYAMTTRRDRGEAILPRVDGLSQVIRRYSNHFPPTYLFLDNQDEAFEENPDYWLASGYGCFRALRALRDLSAHRVHVFATLRSEVVAQFMKSQHFPRWSHDLFKLEWTDRDLIRVFETRASRLKHSLLRMPEKLGQSPLLAFVGKEFQSRTSSHPMIRIPRAEARGQHHISLEQFLLRHTLRRPRDLIVLGNSILNKRLAYSEHFVDHVALVRDAVDRAASEVIAMGYLNQVKEQWPWQNHERGDICDFIFRRVRKNILTRREVMSIEFEYARELGLSKDEVHPFAYLASFGLIGWPVPNPNSQRGYYQHFLKPSSAAENIPNAARYYLVHPVLYGPPFNINVVPGVVVGPDLSFDFRASRKYLSCFISYGSCDEESAIRLYDRLAIERVECWLHVNNGAPGREVWLEIYNQMDMAGKILCLCSAKAFDHSGFVEEVLRQTRMDRGKLLTISFDDEWKRTRLAPGSDAEKARQALNERNALAFWRLDPDEAISALLDLVRRRHGNDPKSAGTTGTNRSSAESPTS